MRISFLTPGAGLVAFAVIVPLIAFVRTERRAERVRSVLQLAAPSGSPRLTVAALLAVAVLVGVAAAQPVLEEWDERAERADAQVFFAFDTSRSMLASGGAGQPTRFDRAVAAAREMRESLGDVPVGIATVTDRILPHLFPSTNRESFDAVLRWSIGVDRPPSERAENRKATNLASTSFFVTGNYFRGARRRVLVLFTDAESSRIRPETLTAEFAGGGVNVVLLRFWADGERLYGPEGLEEAYVADPASKEIAETYAQAVKGETFDENRLSAAIESVRSKLGSKAAVSRVKTVDIEPLGPYVLLVALLPLSYLLVRRNLG